MANEQNVQLQQGDIPITGRLVSIVPSGSVTTADQIRDPGMDNMTQAEINQIQHNRKAYDPYPSYADFPLDAVPEVMYVALDTGLMWDIDPTTGGWRQLTDNFNSIEVVQGIIDEND